MFIEVLRQSPFEIVAARKAAPGKTPQALMLPPQQDQAGRRPIWNELQMFWMDTDPSLFLPSAARACAQSKYSLSEIEHIFWNEVRPAVRFNRMSLLGEWRGFEIGWLSRRILKTHRWGRRLPLKHLHPQTNADWKKLRAEVERIRG